VCLQHNTTLVLLSMGLGYVGRIEGMVNSEVELPNWQPLTPERLQPAVEALD
jgi:hypothetical protein